VINDIGRELTKDAPAVVGLAEVENRKVIEDLLNEKPLKNHDYGIIHYDSPDERGIDVALIYRKLIFQPLSHSSHELILYERDDPDDRDYTRDQLLVTGLLDGDKISFIVNHWPSRSGGEKASRPFRNKAAKLNKSIIDSLQAIEPYAKIITMGDYNDGPYNESVKEILGAKAEKENLGSKGLFNPMENMQKRGIGTIAYRDSWDLFDQIILSKPLLGDDYSSYRYYKAGVFNPNYLANPRGRYQGYPFRSFSGGGFSDGYSDHFPVYIYLVKAVVKAQSNLKKTASK
jgi:endonuclease/exonuclease/phosphatase family metal-dependent hydrolase